MNEFFLFKSNTKFLKRKNLASYNLMINKINLFNNLKNYFNVKGTLNLFFLKFLINKETSNTNLSKGPFF